MTRKIKVGNVYIGGGAPISVQSMCNTKTADVENTIKQIISLQNAGCDIVRFAVNSATYAAAIKENSFFMISPPSFQSKKCGLSLQPDALPRRSG